jgi:hypothetical protein
MERSRDCWPPFHLVAMTPFEVTEYNFIVATHAIRVV